MERQFEEHIEQVLVIAAKNYNSKVPMRTLLKCIRGNVESRKWYVAKPSFAQYFSIIIGSSWNLLERRLREQSYEEVIM